MGVGVVVPDHLLHTMCKRGTSPVARTTGLAACREVLRAGDSAVNPRRQVAVRAGPSPYLTPGQRATQVTVGS